MILDHSSFVARLLFGFLPYYLPSACKETVIGISIDLWKQETHLIKVRNLHTLLGVSLQQALYQSTQAAWEGDIKAAVEVEVDRIISSLLPPPRLTIPASLTLDTICLTPGALV
jgi:hypothetical protein